MPASSPVSTLEPSSVKTTTSGRSRCIHRFADGPPRGDVPEPDGVVQARGERRLAVGAESDIPDGPGVGEDEADPGGLPMPGRRGPRGRCVARPGRPRRPPIASSRPSTASPLRSLPSRTRPGLRSKWRAAARRFDSASDRPRKKANPTQTTATAISSRAAEPIAMASGRFRRHHRPSRSARPTGRAGSARPPGSAAGPRPARPPRRIASSDPSSGISGRSSRCPDRRSRSSRRGGTGS